MICKCKLRNIRRQKEVDFLFDELKALDNYKIQKWRQIMNETPRSPQQGQFLPCFLLGETEVCSPEVSLRKTKMSMESMNVSPPSTSPLQLHNARVEYNKKPAGPPTTSLFDEESDVSNPNSSSMFPNCDRIESMNAENEGHWVIVYGFPASASAYVLSIFSQLGQVIEHTFPANGNWMFIKFKTRSDVRKALTYNERVINNNIMIGVSERKNINSMRSSCSSPPLNASRITSPVMSPGTPTGGIRHLTSPRRELNTTQPTPQKDTSTLAKAIDLFYGWL